MLSEGAAWVAREIEARDPDSYEARVRWILRMAALEDERGPIEVGGTAGRRKHVQAAIRSRRRVRFCFQVAE